MNVAIIAAAGQGRRLAGKRPKQFLELTGIPIIIHTLRTFERCDDIHEIITVVAEGEVESFLSLASAHGVKKLSRVVAGGATRAESVLRGLEAAPEHSQIVAVHDGVRPFVTIDEISRTVESAKLNGAAVLVSAGVDTVKEVNDGVIVKTLDRSRLRNALTPQCFRYELLKRAYANADVADPSLTDESSLLERLGEPVAVVEGSARNIKITTAEDLLLGEVLLKRG